MALLEMSVGASVSVAWVPSPVSWCHDCVPSGEPACLAFRVLGGPNLPGDETRWELLPPVYQGERDCKRSIEVKELGRARSGL